MGRIHYLKRRLHRRHQDDQQKLRGRGRNAIKIFLTTGDNYGQYVIEKRRERHHHENPPFHELTCRVMMFSESEDTSTS